MIKKIKHILNNNNKENHHHGNSTTSSTNSYEFTPTVLSKQMNLSHSKLNSTSPGNFLKKSMKAKYKKCYLKFQVNLFKKINLTDIR